MISVHLYLVEIAKSNYQPLLTNRRPSPTVVPGLATSGFVAVHGGEDGVLVHKMRSLVKIIRRSNLFINEIINGTCCSLSSTKRKKRVIEIDSEQKKKC